MTNAIPKLRFPGFRGEWEEKKFYDLLDQVLDFRGRTPLKLSMTWGGDIPSLSALNVKMGYIDISIDPHFGSEELYRKWMINGDLEKNDIVFTMEAPLGNVALIPDNRKYILSQRVVALKTNENADNKFLYHLMSAPKFQNMVERLGTGSTAKGINQMSLKKIKVTLPAVVDEQKKIAGFLAVVDDGVAVIDKMLKLLKKYKKGVMQKIFTQKTRFKQGNGKSYPDWRTKKLDEVAEVSPGSSKSSEINPEGNNVIVDMGAVSADGRLLESKKTFSIGDALETTDLVMAKDDIGGGNIIGKVVMIPESNKYVCGDHVYRLKVHGVDTAYLYYAINSPTVSRSFRSKANGTAQIGITNNTVKNQPIQIPAEEEQQKIADFLTAIDDKIKLEEAKLTQAKKFKKSLLQRMFA